ncbi:MAG: NfeD family protein [Prevotella bivia]|uniref:Membrane protein n=1 Tax=Prevotella bivia DNF00320 TaxID=1401068 RepID=A0A096AE10_9BACT|nr:NfeD family protein [Prevotella bivia]KGF45155.1 membrane protein [Prevotella bivia DNF00320]MDK7762156.1 NfeD family protein [Prevotella bivia]MDU2328502.1 NfeD family protein [Prevotella bivia]MDU6554719.1 NfeD family protein [Prevotella bivia]
MFDYLAQNLWLVWTLVSLLCLILELTSGDFFVMCFAIGGIFTTLLSPFVDSLTIQIITFSVCSVLSIIFVRPVMLKYFHRHDKNRVSNADALIGREGRITEPIEGNGFGRVQIDGDYWKARSVDGVAIAYGQEVRIISRDSIIVTVEKLSIN